MLWAKGVGVVEKQKIWILLEMDVMGPLGVMITILVFYIQVYWRDLIRGVCTIFSVRLWNFKDGGSKKARLLAKNQYTQRKPLYFVNTGSTSSSEIGYDFRK